MVFVLDRACIVSVCTCVAASLMVRAALAREGLAASVKTDVMAL